MLVFLGNLANYPCLIFLVTALGTLESANRLFFKWLAFFFVKNSPLLPHLHKKLVFFAEF